MLRLLIVDDDILARTYVKEFYPWAQEGFALVEDASNAEEALARAEEERLDVVLTDLNMPGMGGIELIGRLRAQGFDGGLLVLSCHEEFAYVKEAMRLGADEYLLKSCLSKESLCQALARVTQCLAARRAAAEEQALLRRMAEKGSRMTQRELIEALLSRERGWEEQYAETRQAGLRHRYYRAACILLSAGDAQPAREQPLLGGCRRIAAPHGGELIDLGRGRYAALYDFSGEPSSMRQSEVLSQQGAELTRFLSGEQRVECRAGVSMVCEGGGTVARAVRQAEEALHLTFYGGTLRQFDEASRLTSRLPGACEQFLQELPHALARGDGAAISAGFAEALHALAQRHVREEAVRGFLRACDTAAEAERPAGFYEGLGLLADCARCLPAYLALADAAALRAQGLSPAVSRAMQYVRRHYTEPIGLGHAAREVGLSLPYLSRAFKRETGMGFNEYLLDCRLREVCGALESSLDTIKSIAAHAGFHDYQHFCKVFKKKYGQSPASYRKERQRPPAVQ